MEGFILIVVIAILLVFMMAGVPLVFCLGLTGFLGLLIFADWDTATTAFRIIVYQSPQNFVLLAVPLFILMAEILVSCGIGASAYEGISKIFSGIKGGLAYATIVMFTAMGAATGSSTASLGAIGPSAIKEMTERKYVGWLATGVIGGTGGLAIIIPPSVLMIVYGFIAEVSVPKLFIAGVLPGLLMSMNYMIATAIIVAINPKWAPASPSISLKERILAVTSILPVLFLGILIMVVIYAGLTTPTEAAAIGVFGSLVVVVIYRKFSWSNLLEALIATAKVTGFALIIVVGALIFGFMLSYLRLPNYLAQWTIHRGFSPQLLLWALMVLLFFLGCIMDTISIVLIVVPIVLPMLLARGMDPIWLGLVICVNMEIALSTPPFGMNLFVTAGIAKPFGIPYRDVVIGNVPYILAALVSLVLCIIFPNIALWLPNLMYR